VFAAPELRLQQFDRAPNHAALQFHRSRRPDNRPADQGARGKSEANAPNFAPAARSPRESNLELPTSVIEEAR
jgi:hypothetical protein